MLRLTELLGVPLSYAATYWAKLQLLSCAAPHWAMLHADELHCTPQLTKLSYAAPYWAKLYPIELAVPYWSAQHPVRYAAP